MNVHAPQTVESQAEARNIMAVKYQIVSPQSNSPVMSVIQDSLAGAYLLSAPGVTLSRSEMMQCVIDIPGWDGVLEQKDVYPGADLISMTLPMVNWKRGGVEILKGKLISGQLNKKVLGRSQGSLIHVIYNDCGPDETILFIHRLQKVVHRYLTIRGFSIGISDMMTAMHIRETVHQERTQAFKDIEHETNENIINQRLNICRDSMGKMVQEPLDDTNSFFCTVNSGSKGSSINISQIMAVVGQQNLCGKRIPKTWTDRTLPHFKRGSNGPLERGFIQHSYVEGLSPAEVWYHAIAGREGMIDTACKTSITGYIERRFIKALENIVIHWDGTVRNSGKVLVQFKYGDDGFDAMRVEKQRIDTYNYPHEMNYGGIKEEYDQVVKDHYFLQELDKWKDPSLKDTEWFMLPINVSRIIHNTQTLFDFPSRKVNEQEVYEAVQALIEGIDNDMLKILIRSELNSQKLVWKHKASKDNLDLIVHEIKKQYNMIASVPGEAVGAIAAQSLGEPATQIRFTLLVYHQRM
jgi:DNA-directed RNA polymerase II subunit RPB1